jgi:hypothetical protein
MSKSGLSKITKSMHTVMKKHSAEILTGIGIAGMITTTVIAVRSTPKALILIEDKKIEIGTDELSLMETVKTVWICYIPTVITGIVSVVCLIGASSENVRRNAALATAYTLSESALKEYQEKVIETIGERKEREVRDSIAKDRIAGHPIGDREIIIVEKGNTQCYDAISDRYFKSDIDKLKKAENELNRRMLNETYISLNEFYYEIGLKNIDIGDDLGWNIDKGFIDLRFSSQLADDGTPCLVLDYRVAPRYDYNRQH